MLLSVTTTSDGSSQPLAGSSPADFVVAGNHAYFTAEDSAHGRELWRTDGTSDGTVLVGDLTEGPTSSSVSGMTVVGEHLFVLSQPVGDWDTSSTTLWAVSTTTHETTALASGVFHTDYGHGFGVLGDSVFFFRETAGGGEDPAVELWKTNGTQAGTYHLMTFANFYATSRFEAVGNSLYFIAKDTAHGTELWKTDGSTSGTVLVKDIAAAAGASSYPSLLAAENNVLYFSASDAGGDALWRTDPIAGAVKVIDSVSGEWIEDPRDLVTVGNAVYVTVWTWNGPDGSGTGFRRVDNAATDAARITDLGALRSAWGMTTVGSTVYFNGDDGSTGNELWRISGTNPPELVRNIFSPFATEDFRNNPNVPEVTYEIEPNDGPDTAEDLRGSFAEVEPGIFEAVVGGWYDGRDGLGDWYRIDLPIGYKLEVEGATAGIFDSQGERLSYGSQYIARTAADYYVKVHDSWESLGTAYFATVRVSVADDSSYPFALTPVGDTLFFVAENYEHGAELWRTDPAQGAVLVADLAPGQSSSGPSNLTDVNGELYFLANGGGELWKATTAGAASRIATIRDDGDGTVGSGSYGAMALLNGSLLFAADDGIHGSELWTSDLDSGRTMMLKDIRDPVERAPESILTFGTDGYWRLARSDGESLTQTTFASWSTNVTWTSVVQGDFNGDGLMDVAGRTHIGQWWASINRGDGTSQTSLMTYWRPALDIVDVVSGDFNGDGRTDIAGRTSSGVWWAGFAKADSLGFVNQRIGAWSPTLTWQSVQTGDFNGDGRTDIASLATDGRWFGLLENDGKWESVILGAWSPSLNFTDDIFSGDFNGDGRTDLVGRTESGQWWAAIANAGAVGFTNTPFGVWAATTTWTSVAAGDFDGDGTADIVGRSANGQWWGMLSRGATSTRSNTLFGYWNPNVVWTGIVAGDADGDGRTDIVGRVAAAPESLRGRFWVGRKTDADLMATQAWGFQSAAADVETRNIFFARF